MTMQLNKSTRAFWREWAAKMGNTELLAKFESIGKLKDEVKSRAKNPYSKDMFTFERLEDAYNILEAELVSRNVQENKPQEDDYE